MTPFQRRPAAAPLRRPSPQLRAIVEEEERLLAQVRAVLGRATGLGELPDYDGELLALRDALAEERLADDRAMLLEQMDRMAALSAARERYDPQRPDTANPYFAHLLLEIDGRGQRDLLLGPRTFLRGDVRIIDWRHAPISRVFYRFREGDYFAEEIAGRQLEGEVLARRVVTVVDGRLVRVAAPQGTCLRTAAGWRMVEDERRLAGGAGSATRPDTAGQQAAAVGPELRLRSDKHLPAISALLDPEQFDLLTRDPEALLVVAGGAGSGKTTVGLHRLAWLAYQDDKRFRSGRMLVLVFGRALARYIAKVLPALGVEGVPVKTLSDWAQAMRRRHFPKLTPEVIRHTPAEVVRFKTHRILVPMLERAARDKPDARPEVLFDELFTDRDWLGRGVAQHAPGAFSADELDRIQRWCADQHFRRVDPDDRADEEPAGYDEEDAPILLRLQQLLRGRLVFRGRRRLSYDHLLVDEVQDFSPLELLVLLDTVRGGSVTLAGDPAQHITDNDFSDWSEVLRLLGQQHVEVRPLQVSYRSPRWVAELGRAVLGPLAPTDPLRAGREGMAPELLRFGDAGAALTLLADTLADLMAREPQASVAVLARDARQADEAYDSLNRADLPALARVRDQEFSFGPGIEVTDVAQTKGLEFDYVVLLGADGHNYPATDAARHLLHVGITRAIHQLWLLVWRSPSTLLPDWLEARLGG